MSHLTRGAWIEMYETWVNVGMALSHLTRGAWIEIYLDENTTSPFSSHLTRGAWIEIFLLRRLLFPVLVAPHTRCVD